jgi:hypothetical protein
MNGREGVATGYKSASFLTTQESLQLTSKLNKFPATEVLLN